ncbi:MAG: 7-carboxy-7-deazaguanine synthase QueE [Candidatus Omnitrophota bacterium]
MKGRIFDVFDSVQGEGLFLGEKQIFVRLYGCNLSCRYCDTPLDRFREYEPEELVDEIKLYQDDFHSISFTGGEPLLQKDFLREVLKMTSGYGYRNYLETNGTLAGELQDVIDYVDILSIDLKLPSSTGMGLLWGLHRRFLKVAARKENFIKAVVCSATIEEDLRYAAELIRDVSPSSILVLQPNSFDYNEHLQVMLGKFREICAEAKITACIIPQMHKLIGVK